jgi:hypothetical protein
MLAGGDHGDADGGDLYIVDKEYSTGGDGRRRNFVSGVICVWGKTWLLVEMASLLANL